MAYTHTDFEQAAKAVRSADERGWITCADVVHAALQIAANAHRVDLGAILIEHEGEPVQDIAEAIRKALMEGSDG